MAKKKEQLLTFAAEAPARIVFEICRGGIRIDLCEYRGSETITTAEARALRDWLNKVIDK